MNGENMSKIDNEDLLVVCKALDKIITSERKEIKNAFRELMIMASLTEDDTAGPLLSLIGRVDRLEYEISSIKRDREREREWNSRYHHDRDCWWGANKPTVSDRSDVYDYMKQYLGQQVQSSTKSVFFGNDKDKK